MRNKSKFSGLINIVNEISTIARKRGIVHLFTQDNYLDGRIITVDNKQMVNFGSCSYLGLETDDRLKNAAIDAVKRFGTQFSSSRTYVSFTLYEELEDLLGKVFGSPVILSSNTTLGHNAIIPIVVGDNDVVIIDQQAHISMQEAIQKLTLRGIEINVIRHNKIELIQESIERFGNRYEKIWYFLDGVYSMYGDFAPAKALSDLVNKYPKLHLYIDDAHGMSWKGKNGSGYFLSNIEVNSNIILATSLAKGFGSAGGVFRISDEELFWRVKNWGGALTYSGPQQPAVVAASIASAKIHLSPEINVLQAKLAERIRFCNEALKRYNLPVIAESESPIFFIGLGLTKMGYEMVKRLVDDGFFVNLGIFPAVPQNCTGIRFTITNHHTFNDIEKLAARIAYHLPKVLAEENKSVKDIAIAFKGLLNYNEIGQEKVIVPSAEKNKPEITIQHETTIHAISQEVWNKYMGGKGAFDWKALSFFECIYSDNLKPEDNWKFHYYIIRDSLSNIVLVTFFTEAITKDDMLSSQEISKQVEEKRKKDPYYLTSKAFLMGSLWTNGEHLFLDRKNSQWKDALKLLLKDISSRQSSINANLLQLRDFNTNDSELKEFLIDNELVPVRIPSTSILNLKSINSLDDFFSKLEGKKRNRIKREVLKYSPYFVSKWKTTATIEETDYWYSLYLNVKDKNLSVNSFAIPKKFFSEVAGHPDWEIVELYIPNYAPHKPVAVGFIFKSTSTYCPVVLGLDYQYVQQFNTYRQLLFTAICRAIELKVEVVYLGLTANEDKGKFGAITIPQLSYIQIRDDYNLTVLNLMPEIDIKTVD